MPTIKTRPRYRFCWWCNNRLRGNSHMVMRATESAAGASNVIVHSDCAWDMEREGGWEEACSLF